MASRKRFGNLPKQRTGLRSQRRQQQEDVAADEADPAWDTVEDDEGMAGAWAASAAEATATGGLEPELLTMMRHFLAAQDRREEDLLAEIRGLRMSLPPRPPPAPSLPVPATPSTVTASSPRLQLPTPAPRRGHLETPSEVPSLRFSDAHDRGELQRPEWRLYGEPKIPPYQRGEDIENYLLRFERIAKTWQWPETEWACRLVPLLSGKALEAYTAMDEERAHYYHDLKAALLAKFDISPETYRQQFRSTMVPPGENPTETYHRLKGLYRRWIRPEQRTKEEVGEAIILEQLLCVLPSEVRTWVKEHEPADGLTAAKLGLQYLNARRGGPPTRQSAATRPALLPLPPRHARRESPSGLGNTNQFTAHLAAGKSFVCYYCQQPGHKASVCPIRKAKVTGACYAPRLEAPLETSGEGRLQRYKTVVINGQQVTALLDSGSFTSCIRQHLVPLASCDYTRTVDIMCVHGDEHKYPTADLTVSINEQPYMLNAGVVEKLPVDALLGWDLPVLLDLLLETETPVETDSGENGGGGVVEGNVTCPVITRAQAKTGVPLLTDSDNSLCEGGTPEPKAEAAEAQPLSDFDNSLFEGGTKGLRKSRRQRRFEKQLRSAVPDSKNLLSSTMWDVPDNISMLQSGDDTLKNLFAKVTNGNSVGEKFMVDEGVLYTIDNDHKRLVVPVQCRDIIMHLAHSLPWAGHLGRHKTYLRVSSRFYWPSMYTDIQKYCATCPTCQKSCTTRKSDRAFLRPLPVISIPFRRIAMDIVGPLLKSSGGHQYILVVCDYATRFPEAFPLRTITAPAVLRALVQLFSRVGIPDEILTDQGTNFTSKLSQLFYKQLGISPIKTTPYHPQTDGLVERFNQTLKRMLQKFVDDTGKDWDRWLPFLLFAYREVPQASTGFSPFELLYGWDVQGPLDLLRKHWEAPSSNLHDRGVVQYVLEIRERLARYQEEAEVNLSEAQKHQKTWYDQQARHREFQPGQKVLLLLPSSNNKLLAKWQGPYVITRKMGPVTYEVHHPEKKKPRQKYHVNLLKEWKERPASISSQVLMVRKVETEEEPDTGLETLATSASPVLTHLEQQQATQLLQVFKETPTLFTANPGKTSYVEHAIRLKDGQPIRQRPYRIPQHLVGKLQQEVEEMLRLQVIEPSNSEWCSPVVIVFKKDGSLRICIDFRKLNSISEFDAYPMPRIDDLLEKIGAAKYITTLDLCKGYWQVPLVRSCRPYTAFRTPAGLYQFTVMPFGLHGAPATFQRLMDKVLEGCDHCSAAYLDDVVIFSDNWEEHVCDLALVLGKIQKAGLTLNLPKCEWAKRETSYLGYQLGRGEVRPQVDKVEAIQKCPRPRTKKEVRSFLGLAGWYRRFVPQFATIAAPLTELTRKDQKNLVNWSDDCEAAFSTLKAHLCSSPVLRSPDFKQRFLVQVDASAIGLGAVLAQGIPGEECPILYLSRKLQPQETRYSTVEKEGLAIKWTLESLRYYLLGREFDLETDHRALTWINTMKDHNSRLTRWYLSLQPFRFSIRHRSGKINVVADCLSRLPYTDNLPEEGDDVTE
uniref:uncharacterized protein LOC122760682 n=1 Tax=Solea senegalensis TaxID=28829 RepID=UPI001CD822B4|nr:uncharacterized protein LOC122760682 [Solea senegalensis]